MGTLLMLVSLNAMKDIHYIIIYVSPLPSIKFKMIIAINFQIVITVHYLNHAHGVKMIEPVQSQILKREHSLKTYLKTP